MVERQGVLGEAPSGKTQATPIVRASTALDLPGIQRIYAHHVRYGTGSFEEEPPEIGELMRRREGVVAAGLPHLVAETTGGVCGFAYAGRYNLRSAYRFTVEDSVYVAPDAIGLGIGRTLLAELQRICGREGYRQMVAVIGDSGNERSIRLHRSAGFHEVGVLRSVGRKSDRSTSSSCSAHSRPTQRRTCAEPVPANIPSFCAEADLHLPSRREVAPSAQKKGRTRRPEFWEETSKKCGQPTSEGSVLHRTTG